MRSVRPAADAVHHVLEASFYVIQPGAQPLDLRPDCSYLGYLGAQRMARVVRGQLGRLANIRAAAVPDLHQTVALQQSHHLAGRAHGDPVLVDQVAVRRQTISGTVFVLLNGPPN